jgi:hypothetical protein
VSRSLHSSSSFTPTDPRTEDDPGDRDLDELKILDQAAWNEIYAYCSERIGPDTDHEPNMLRVEVAPGMKLHLDIDKHVTVYVLHVDAEDTRDDYTPHETDSPYLSHIGPWYDRLRREIADAMAYDAVFTKEDFGDNDIAEWRGRL